MRCDFCKASTFWLYKFEGDFYCRNCLYDTVKKRYFDTREAAENYLKTIFTQDVIKEMETEWDTERVFYFFDRYAILDDLISYLNINAYKVDGELQEHLSAKPNEFVSPPDPYETPYFLYRYDCYMMPFDGGKSIMFDSWRTADMAEMSIARMREKYPTNMFWYDKVEEVSPVWK